MSATRLAGTMPVRALLISRLLILCAGIAGALAVPRLAGWNAFDPAQVTTHLGTVGNVLGAPSIRWDSVHYLTVARHGYQTAADTAFLPLYPLLVAALGAVTGSVAASGVLVSVAAFAAAVGLLHRLTELELGPSAADTTLLLIAFAPLSFFFSAVYTESLFLALSVGAVYAARRGRFGTAVGLAALASVTRVTGILLVIPIAMVHIAARGRPRRGLALLAVVPATLASYLLYLAARGYGLLAPFVQQTLTAHQHRMTGPVETVISAIKAASSGLGTISTGLQPFFRPTLGGPFSQGAQSIVLLAVLLLGALALASCLRRLPAAYGIYASASLLVCIWSPVGGQPLQSLDRYLLTIFPLWMAAGASISDRRLTRPAVALGALLLTFYTFEFATWAFVA